MCVFTAVTGQLSVAVWIMLLHCRHTCSLAFTAITHFRFYHHSVAHHPSRWPHSLPIASDGYTQTIEEFSSISSNVSADPVAMERLRAAYDDAVQGLELQKVDIFCSHFHALYDVFVTHVFRCG